MKTFQIEQRYSGGGKSWDYLETESTNEEEIKKLAIDIVKKSYQKNYDSPVFRLSAPEKPKPTIYIKEYKVKGGLSFTTKWRQTARFVAFPTTFCVYKKWRIRTPKLSANA